MRASRLIAIAAAAGISAVILGCAAPTASGPIANGPASTTSPTPRVDAAAAFIAIVTDPAFSARIERTGTLTTNGVPRPDSGTYEFDAAYEHSAYVDDAGGSYPRWSYSLENDTEWKTGATMKITVTYSSDPGAGTYYIKVVIPNGIADEFFFSM